MRLNLDIPKAPDGDKYVTAKKWGHIHIVNRKWFDQSISRRACLDEELYSVQDISSSCNDAKVLYKEKTFQGPSNAISQFVSPAILEELEAASSQNISISDTYAIKSEAAEENPVKMQNNSIETNFEQTEDTAKVDLLVAQDSEEDDDLYLSSCRICLLGFEDKVLRKLLSMIRGGGGTRHTTLSEKLTHIILGTPSEIQMKEVRYLAAWGVIYVVNATWLEESYRAKRELPVLSRHIFPALMIAKDSTSSCMVKSVFVHGVKKVDSNHVPLYATNSHITEDKMHSSNLISSEKNKINGNNPTINDFSELVASCERSHHQSMIEIKQKEKSKLHSSFDIASSLNSKATFRGNSFCFSVSFPIEQRPEVIEWVKGGGGVILDDQAKNANFIIECHGLTQVLHANVYQSTTVTTHWIRSSLEDGCMQDVANHILYSPLRCHVPLPGFEVLRFCVSQYDGKERILLRNLCYALGAKFTEKLTKKVTHLLCKFTNGPKYEAAFRKGIQIVTAEWITECVSQDKLVPTNSFKPRPATSEDKEAGLCTVSQHPTQAVGMISFSSQSQSQNPGLMKNLGINFVSKSSKESEDSCQDGKRLKLSECDENIDTSERNKVQEFCGEDKKTVPDVADAIEDLLAQSDKIQDLKSPVMSGSEKSIFAPDHPIIGQSHGNSHSSFGIPKQCLVRPQKQDSISHTSNQTRKSGPYDPFSETQTESQVVGYEEDLTGRQKIIERVRSQSLTLTSDVK